MDTILPSNENKIVWLGENIVVAFKKSFRRLSEFGYDLIDGVVEYKPVSYMFVA